MKVATAPLLADDLTPMVALHLGEEAAELTAAQAEDIASALNRAATAARYEAGIAETLKGYGYSPAEIKVAIGKIRSNVAGRMVKRN